MNEGTLIMRFTRECEVARIYGLPWERVFATIPQSHVARVISLAEADTAPRGEPVEVTEAEQAWIDQYHADAMNNEHEEEA